MRRAHSGPAVLVTLVLLSMIVMPAAAGIDIDLGARVQLGDDSDVFISVAAQYHDQDKERVRNLGYRYKNDPDDLAVALFIGSRSGRSAEWVFRQRKDGHGWFQISLMAGLPPDVWFVPVKRPPGPPYGKAYGHFKKHRGGGAKMDVSDVDARNLVAVRMIHEYYDVPIEVAMEWRSSGRDLRVLMAGEYHRRHGHGTKAGKAIQKHKSSHVGKQQVKAKDKKKR